MTADDLLRNARRQAGLSQRELAARSGLAQSAIARLEAGRTQPGFETLQKLLLSCGLTLDARPLSKAERARGIDRSAIRELLRLTPTERLRLAAAGANNVARLLRSASRTPPAPASTP